MKLNSLVRDSHWAWSGDPALDVPPPLDVANPTDEDKKAHAELMKAWETRLTNARDTGDYSSVTKAGSALSLFSLRMIPKLQFDTVVDAVSSQDIGVHVGNCKLVKLAVRGVTNLHDFDGNLFKVDLKGDGLVQDDLLDLLAAYAAEARRRGYTGPDPISEMANHIIRRQNGPSPK